jgi:hypothetical protein
MTKREKKKTKENFCEIVRRFQAIEPCCNCHPHGEYKDCDFDPKSSSPCKKTCAQVKFQELVIRMLLEYMIIWQFVPITEGRKKKSNR